MKQILLLCVCLCVCCVCVCVNLCVFLFLFVFVCARVCTLWVLHTQVFSLIAMYIFKTVA